MGSNSEQAASKLRDRVKGAVSDGALGLMLYGSHARSTANEKSDVDVLELVGASPRAFSVDEINITQYTPAGLRMIAERGSIFVLHLRQDGQILFDPHGILEACLACYQAPATYDDQWNEITIASGILIPSATDAQDYAHQLGRLGLYLLRSAVYLRSLEVGAPSFDLTVLEHQDPDLHAALELRRTGRLRHHDIQTIRDQLARFVDIPPCAPGETVESYAIGFSTTPTLTAMLTSVLARGDGVDYVAMTLPPL